MHFVFYPKHQYGCPHVSHCPHLGGASLGFLVHAADEQTEYTDSLLRQIDALRAANAAKNHQIEALTAETEQLTATTGLQPVVAVSYLSGNRHVCRRCLGLTRPKLLHFAAKAAWHCHSGGGHFFALKRGSHWRMMTPCARCPNAHC